MPPHATREWTEIMTVEQVAAYLQLNKLTIYRYIREGRLPAARIGKAYRVRKADVDAFLLGLMARPATRRLRRAARPAVPVRPAAIEPVPTSVRAERVGPRDRDLSANPMEWVIRGFH